MATAQFNFDQLTNPVDMVEHIATIHDWTFERSAPDELTLTVSGSWCDYHISLTWRDDLEALHFACAFDFKVTRQRLPEIYRLLALINEQLWLGHFDLWKEDGMLLYRHGLLLAGAESHAAQCEALLRSALEIVRALLSILPVRAVGGEIGRAVARRHHARDARPGMSLRLAGPLLLVGAGKMGGALLEGWLRQGLDPAHVFVSDPAPPEDVAALIASRGIETAELPAKPSAIVIAVKPQLVDETLKALTPKIGKGTVVLSIAAGRTLASLARTLPKGTAIVRAMPNTAAAVGHSMTVACANDAVSRDQALECAHAARGGRRGDVDRGRELDGCRHRGVRQRAGLCVPARRMSRGSRTRGGARCRAREQVGASDRLWRRRAPEPAPTSARAKLRENVTSPKGTTAAALEVLMGKGGFKELLIRAVAAAAKRSRELSS